MSPNSLTPIRLTPYHICNNEYNNKTDKEK